MIPGIKTRVTSTGIPVARIHYSTMPDRRPGTPEGDAWIARASMPYGGLNSPRWRKEQEIEWSAMGGMRLFPQWEQWVALGKIVIPPFTPEGYRLYGAYDHGWRNPCAYIVFGVNSDGDIVALWETYGEKIGVMALAKIIKGEDAILPDGRRFQGNPFAGQEVLKISDPSIWAEDQPMSDNTNKSIAELFRRQGIHFTKGEKGGDTMVAEWLHGHFWKDPEKPLFRITTNCPKLIWEIGQQRHREVSAKVALTRDQPEELIDKDNHAFDAMKMFLKRFPPRAMRVKPEKKTGTFNWWRELAKRGGAARDSYA